MHFCVRTGRRSDDVEVVKLYFRYGGQSGQPSCALKYLGRIERCLFWQQEKGEFGSLSSFLPPFLFPFFVSHERAFRDCDSDRSL